jgi:transposase-like protein
VKCPRCNTEDGITAVRYTGPYDAISFQFNCSKCWVNWKRRWGTRRRGSRAERMKEMSNVKIEESYMERVLRESKDK